MGESESEQAVSEALQLMNSGELDQALSTINVALEQNSKNARLLYMKGCVLSELGQIEEAIEAYQISAQNAGEMAVTPLYNLANLYKEQADFPNAVSTYHKVLEIDPTVSDAWINLGCILDDHGQHQTALECYDNALRIDNQDPMTWSNRGNSLRALSKLEEAEESFRKALELDDSDLASSVGLGGCMVARGDADGLVLLEQAFESSQHPAVLFELATALATLDRFADALESYDRLASDGMDNASLWNNRGECLAKMGRTDDALLSFDRAIAADAEFEAAYFGKARLLHNLDRYAEAKPVVAQLLAVASDEFKATPGVQALLSLSVTNNDT